MIEYLAELYKSHFRIVPGRVNDFPSESLPKGMCAEVIYFYPIALFDFLEDYIDALRGIHLLLSGKEYRLVFFRGAQFLVTVLDMLLESGIDSYYSSFPGLLLKKLK